MPNIYSNKRCECLRNETAQNYTSSSINYASYLFRIEVQVVMVFQILVDHPLSMIVEEVFEKITLRRRWLHVTIRNLEGILQLNHLAVEEEFLVGVLIFQMLLCHIRT